MRIARLARPGGNVSYARLDGDRAYLIDGPPWSGGVETGEVVPYAVADLREPVTPSKIVGIGRNYAAHARELGHEVPLEPLFFLKAPSALIGPGQVVVIPRESARVEHEAELGVVIGKRCKRVAREEALGYVFGYTAVADVTARDLQRADGQWTRAKSFDTFCPVGPYIETDLDPSRVRVRCRVGSTLRQDGATDEMIFDVPALVAFVSRMMTLEPGDLIATGTPEGVGPLVAGDRMEIEIAPEQGEPLVLCVSVTGPTA